MLDVRTLDCCTRMMSAICVDFFFCFWPTASARCKKRGLLSQLFGEYLIEIYAKVNPSNGLLKKISLGDEMVS